MRFTAEQMKKAAACKSTEELAAFAKAEGFELTAQEIESFIAAAPDDELKTDILDAVTGGVGNTGCHNIIC